jgi:hypothetical protein
LWDFSFHDVAIFLATVVSGVENFNSVHFYDEHSCSHDVASDIWSDFDAFFLGLYSEFNWHDSFEGIENLLSVE